ncbi:MAG: DUF4143 domain-containing protein [Rhodothermales bacterium]
MAEYYKRIVDGELDDLLGGVAALSLDGPKAVGKTVTAQRRAATVISLDDSTQRAIIAADPRQISRKERPVLIDEWQYVPEVWDVVRRAVDEDRSPGQFILTGSAGPTVPRHSGAGRIVRVRMRPLSIAERTGLSASVSLANMLDSGKPGPVSGTSDLTLESYVDFIVESGFPGIRELTGRSHRQQIAGYLERIVDQDFDELGVVVRKPDLLRRWMAAYAAATSTTASYETIRDAATAGTADKPAKSTVIPYRDTLERLFILDEVPAWIPSRNYLGRLTRPPKHQLVDPALAVSLLGLSRKALLEGEEAGPPVPRDGTLLGHLFESLVTQSVKVYAQACEANVYHMRTMGERHEVDLIIARPDGRFVAAEVKLSSTPEDSDAAHLHWLKEKAGADMLDAMIITTGPQAYRRKDGIAVVPAALLGP